MTKCLAQHAEQIQPRCKHLLDASGVFEHQAEELGESHEEDAEDEAKDHAEELEASAEAARQEAERKKRVLHEARVKEAEAEREAVEKKEEADEKKVEERKATDLLAAAKKAAQEAVDFARRPPPLSMKAALQTMHDRVVSDISTTRAAMKEDVEKPTDVENPPTDQEEEMSEATPAWITGDIEKPQGEKDMGGWVMRTYTPEQQERLHVDELGKAMEAPTAHEAPPQEQAQPEVEPAVVTTPPATKTTQPGWWQQLMLACEKRLTEAPHWVVFLAGLGFFAALLLAFIAGRCRRRQSALHSTYAKITVDEASAVPMVTTTFGSEDQL